MWRLLLIAIVIAQAKHPEAFRNNTSRETESSPGNAGGSCRSIKETLAQLESFKIDAERPLWHHYTFETGSYNREELQIVEVVVDKDLQLDERISQWTSLKNRAVGLGERGLTLVEYLPSGVSTKHYDMGHTVSSACLFEWWNAEEAATHAGLAIARDGIVDWHQIDDGNALNKLWEWNLNGRVFHLSVYRMKGNWKAAVTREQTGERSRAVSIYGMDLWNNWWFEDKLDGYEKATIVNEGRYLAVSLEDRATVSIYKFDVSSGRYSLFKNVASANAKSIVAFVAGANSFLAIGGESPVIYEIRGSDFVEKNVDHYDVNHVEYFLAVPLGYYRDEAALLFQHKLDHYSHSSSALEALRWDGVKFSPVEHSPCRSHGEEMFGFSCVLDVDDEKGIEGAAVLRAPDDAPRILTASEEYAPTAFVVRTQLVDAPDPLEGELDRILKAEETVLRRAIRERDVLERADALTTTDPGSDVARIREIRAPNLRLWGNVAEALLDGGRVRVAGRDWSDVNRVADLESLLSGVEARRDALAGVLRRLESAVMRDEVLPRTFGVAVASGRLITRGIASAKEASVETLNGLSVDATLNGAARRSEGDDGLAVGAVVVDEFDVEDVRVELFEGSSLPLAEGSPAAVNGDLRVEGHVHVFKDANLIGNGTVNGVRLSEDAVISRAPDADIENANAAALLFDDASVEGALVVESALNGFDFSERGFAEALREKRRLDAESARSRTEMNLDSLTVADELHSQEINGRSWEEFVGSAVFRDGDFELTDLDVDGETIASEELTLDALNSLQFPELYLRTRESLPAAVAAPKRFLTGARADRVDCEEAVSGVLPKDVVTLSSPQNLDNFTFFDLTVTERVNVRGDIAGRELDAFLSNPDLSEAKTVRSNAIFRRLRVVGTTAVLGKVNGSEWSALFDGVAVRSADPVRVDSLKAFEGRVAVESGASVRSGFVNERRFADFLSVDADQTVSDDILAGDISFEDLTVGGTFDAVDVADLAGRSVKISGDRALASDVTFDRTDLPAATPRLRIERRCNDWSMENLPDLGSARPLELEAPRFGKLRAGRVEVAGDLRVDGAPLGEALRRFEGSRLSKTEARTARAPCVAGEARAERPSFGLLNGASEGMLNELAYRSTQTEERIATVEDAATLRAKGALFAAEIDGVDLRRAAERAVPVKGSDVLSGLMRFFDEPVVENIRTEGGRLERLVSDAVRADGGPVEIVGTKRYLRGLGATGNARFALAADALTRSGEQVIDGDVRIAGELRADGGVDSRRLLNREGAAYVKRNVDGSRHLEGDARFPNAVRANRLNVAGLEAGLEGRVDSVSLSAPVLIAGDLRVLKRFGGYDVAEIEEAARADGDFSEASVFFARESPPVVEGGALRISGDLSCSRVLDCSPDEWGTATEGGSYGAGDKKFEHAVVAGDVRAEALGDFVERDDGRERRGPMAFDALFVEGAVDAAAVEGVADLGELFAARLQRDGEQTVEGELEMEAGAAVHRGRTAGKIGSALAPGNGEDFVSASIDFRGNVRLEGELRAPRSGISGLDLAEWAKGASSAAEWRISGDATFEGGIVGEGGLDNRGASDLARLARGRERLLDRERGAISDSERIAGEKTRMREISPAFPPVGRLRLGSEVFLVANDKRKCHGRVWRRAPDGEWRSIVGPVPIGCPSRWESLGDGLAASSEAGACGCSEEPGIVVWTFDGVDLQAVRILPPAESICAPARMEGVLYAKLSSGVFLRHSISKTDVRTEEDKSFADEWRACFEQEATERATLRSGETRVFPAATAGRKILVTETDDRIELFPF